MAILRYSLYFIGVTIIIGALTRLEVWYPGFLNLQYFAEPTDSLGTSEYSPIELIQPMILALSGLLMAWVAWFCPTQRPLAIALGGLSLACFLREMDYVLDLLFVDRLWQALIAVAGALVIAYLYRHWKRLTIAFARAWPSPGLTLFFSASLILFCIVHFVGHEPMWQSLLGDDYVRLVKLAVEEFIELIGYLLWLIASIEYTYQARAIAFQPPEPKAQRQRKRRRKMKERRF